MSDDSEKTIPDSILREVDALTPGPMPLAPAPPWQPNFDALPAVPRRQDCTYAVPPALKGVRVETSSSCRVRIFLRADPPVVLLDVTVTKRFWQWVTEERFVGDMYLVAVNGDGKPADGVELKLATKARDEDRRRAAEGKGG